MKNLHHDARSIAAHLEIIIEKTIPGFSISPNVHQYLHAIIKEESFNYDKLKSIISMMDKTGAILLFANNCYTILFEDMSFISMEKDGEILGCDSIANDFHGHDISILARDHEEFIAASKAIVKNQQKNEGKDKDEDGDSESCDMLYAIYSLVDEMLDPDMSDSDYVDDENWTEEDLEYTEKIISLVIKALGGDAAWSVMVQSGWKDTSSKVEINCSATTEENKKRALAMMKIIERVCKTERFVGAVTEYNDGNPDKKSGYNEYVKTVSSVDMDMKDQSNHEKITAVKLLSEALKAEGWSDKSIQDALEI